MSRKTHTFRLGVDLGGTKIEAAILDASGAVCCRQRTANPGDYDGILAATADLCLAVEREQGLADRSLPLGIGTPGSPSPTSGLMRNCNSTELNGRPLADDLARLTGRAVRMANDADCFALSESRDGAGTGERSVFGVILGTGVGGGIAIEGRLLSGANGIAGEWGHNGLPLERCSALPEVLRRSKRPCYCGAVNCVETWLSGPGLAQIHADLHGRELDATALHSGTADENLRRSLDVYCDIAAAALATVVNVLDPAVIVLGGGLSNISKLYEVLPERIAAHTFSDSFATALRRAQHGDSSGVRGAAWLW